MKDPDKTKEQLIEELQSLRQQNTELRAIESEPKQAEKARRVQDFLDKARGTKTYVPQGGVLWVFALKE